MRILLVEDNPSDVRIFKEMMAENDYDADIYWVMNGHEALDYVFRRNEHITEKRPDIILLDLGLPRISGYDVLKEMKNDPSCSDIPVVILTTSRNPLDQQQCQTLGADAFISKPRNLKEYESLVHKLVTRDFPQLLQRVQ